jgi:hypothetical protein
MVSYQRQAGFQNDLRCLCDVVAEDRGFPSASSFLVVLLGAFAVFFRRCDGRVLGIQSYALLRLF